MMDDTSTERRIVVGFDGSPPAAAALSWALREARLRSAEVWVVRALDDGRHTRAAYAGADTAATARRSAAVRELHSAAEAAQREWGRVTQVLVEDDLTARALTRVADHADLLVLGVSGHHLLTAPTPGPTAAACVRAAACPVVLVREPVDGTFAQGRELADAAAGRN